MSNAKPDTVSLYQFFERIPNEEAEQNPASAHLFIVSPLHGLRLDRMFATHPPMEERVARLEAMARPSGIGSGGHHGGARTAATPSGPWSGSVPESPRRGRGPWG